MRSRAMSRIGVDPLAVLQQVDRGPLAIEVELLPLPQRYSLRVLDVGHHFCGLSRDERIELGADDVCGVFEGGKPANRLLS